MLKTPMLQIEGQEEIQGTYSEICKKRSSPPLCGVMKPWPRERLKDLTNPFSMGFSMARADLEIEKMSFAGRNNGF